MSNSDDEDTPIEIPQRRTTHGTKQRRTAPMGHEILRAPHEAEDEITGVHNRKRRLSTLAMEVRSLDTRLGVVETDIGDVKSTVTAIERSTDWQNSTLRDQSRILSELSAGAIKERSAERAATTEDKVSKRKLNREFIALIIAIALAALEIATRLGGCS